MAALRALTRAQEVAGRSGSSSTSPSHILAALLEDDAGEATAFLRQSGVDVVLLRSEMDAGPACVDQPPSPWRADAIEAIQRAREWAVRYSRFQQVGTLELLAALIDRPNEWPSALAKGDIRRWLADLEAQRAPATIPMDDDLAWRSAGPPETSELARILDANFNRAQEGLRVLEEYARFVLDRADLSESAKSARHRLAEIAHLFPRRHLLLARDTHHDVGTTLEERREVSRPSLASVAVANLRRSQEALRAIEEYVKVERADASRLAKSLRYELYSLERVFHFADAPPSQAAAVRLYWLCDPHSCKHELEWTLDEACQGGVAAIQLRQKNVSDRELLATARRLRAWTAERGVLFIVNDRPDLARIVRADGVHVGQDDLSIRDVRRVVGPEMLVGLSTHSLPQAQSALADGADMIGVGPVFPSATKSFESFPGLDLVREVSASIAIPAFAIGGIDISNAGLVVQAGLRRVAVGHAISSADDPREVARQFLSILADDGATSCASSP
jgi:thiamine-phosphate pyrophosphorylase